MKVVFGSKQWFSVALLGCCALFDSCSSAPKTAAASSTRGA